MNRRRVVVVAAALSCVGAVVAAATAVGLSLADSGSRLTVASRVTLAFGAVAFMALIALYLVDQRRNARGRVKFQRDVQRGIDTVRKETRSALDDLSKETRSALDDLSKGSRSALADLHDQNAGRAKPITAPMLDRRLADMSFHLYRQLEARFVLEEMLEPARPLPPLRGWALSPDVAVELVDRVLSGGVRRVLETGSGVSTLLFALALQKSGDTGKVVAFEHSEQYAAHTRQLLVDHGCSEFAEVIHAPLTELYVNDEPYAWYQLDDRAGTVGEFDLLLVDGPPAATGPRSRLPALPLLRSRLAPNARIFLDDAKREDEQAIIDEWIERHGAEMVAMHRHDKGSAELRIVDPESV